MALLFTEHVLSKKVLFGDSPKRAIYIYLSFMKHGLTKM